MPEKQKINVKFTVQKYRRTKNWTQIERIPVGRTFGRAVTFVEEVGSLYQDGGNDLIASSLELKSIQMTHS